MLLRRHAPFGVDESPLLNNRQAEIQTGPRLSKPPNIAARQGGQTEPTLKSPPRPSFALAWPASTMGDSVTGRTPASVNARAGDPDNR